MPKRPALDRAQIKHVAELASLSLTEQEVDQMAVELEAIIAHVDALEALDTTDVGPTLDARQVCALTAAVPLEPPALREDVVTPSLSQEDALGQAPESAYGGFAVPTFVES